MEMDHSSNLTESTVEHEDVPPDPALQEICGSDVYTEFSEDVLMLEVSTMTSTEKVSQGVNHVEGGWPKKINADDVEVTARYKKNCLKDEHCQHIVMELASNCSLNLTCPQKHSYFKKVLSSCQLKVMEHYLRLKESKNCFPDLKDDSVVEEMDYEPSARIINMLRDPNKIKRTASSLSWHPLDYHKLAVAHSCLEFQRAPKKMSFDSYIWNIEICNKPEMILKPVSPLICLEYNHRDTHILIGGSYNGQIGYWDTRSGSQPVQMSATEHCHKDPVYKVIWLQTKIGTEAFSASTDGQVLFWDIRMMNEPTKQLVLDPSKKGNRENAYGAVSMEFENSMAKFLVGTEQGLVVSCNRKLETTDDPIVCTYSGHHGPIYAIQRNPFFPKNFLTVADWTARIWSEDIKESSLISTKYHMTSLLDGCWSPVRPSVFFTVKMDGTLDVWDILFKQKDPALSLKVCDEALYSIRVRDKDSLVCCGSQLGTVRLLKMSPDLCTLQKNEKALVSEMFERETKREKILEAQYRERHQMKHSCSKEHEGGKDDMEELLACTETEFFETVEAEKKKIEDEEKGRRKVACVKTPKQDTDPKPPEKESFSD
ncbi:dynein intermediate chain ciliary-like protein [Labeo rohita]|uniref:Dynein intermediate chain ciliary-like protein n=1 Tax=Labeo rohita TaxID=84645 RepID=A0A498LPR6_LABRO|nr:dynein intermediate chain ciliary-like protein [Labeo rohita]